MPTKATVIQFFAPVIDVTVNALVGAINQRLLQGQKEFILLISTPGGSVFHGLSAYNYLRGVPAHVTTHNFGSVDSIGVLLFCGGRKRFSVPQARFLLHAVSANFENPISLEENQLDERLKGLRIDIENIAKVIAANTGKSVADVVAAMHNRTTLNPEDAKSWGLVDEVKSELFHEGSEVVSILFQQPQK